MLYVADVRTHLDKASIFLYGFNFKIIEVVSLVLAASGV